jgi:hypothetical protein
MYLFSIQTQVFSLRALYTTKVKTTQYRTTLSLLSTTNPQQEKIKTTHQPLDLQQLPASARNFVHTFASVYCFLVHAPTNHSKRFRSLSLSQLLLLSKPTEKAILQSFSPRTCLMFILPLFLFHRYHHPLRQTHTTNDGKQQQTMDGVSGKQTNKQSRRWNSDSKQWGKQRQKRKRRERKKEASKAKQASKQERKKAAGVGKRGRRGKLKNSLSRCAHRPGHETAIVDLIHFKWMRFVTNHDKTCDSRYINYHVQKWNGCKGALPIPHSPSPALLCNLALLIFSLFVFFLFPLSFFFSIFLGGVPSAPLSFYNLPFRPQ